MGKTFFHLILICDGPIFGTSNATRKRLASYGHLEQGYYHKCVDKDKGGEVGRFMSPSMRD
jgi:hypothetical protein